MNRMWVLILLFAACKSSANRDAGGFTPAPTAATPPDTCVEMMPLALTSAPSSQLQVSPWQDEKGADLPFVKTYQMGDLATLAIYTDLEQADYLKYRVVQVGGSALAGCMAGTEGLSRTGVAYLPTLCTGVYKVYVQGCADPLRVPANDVACGAEQAVPGVFRQQPVSNPEQVATFQTLNELQDQIMEKAAKAYQLMRQAQADLEKKPTLTAQEQEFLKLAAQVIQTGESNYALGVWDEFESTMQTGPLTLAAPPTTDTPEPTSTGATPTECLGIVTQTDTQTNTQTNTGYDTSAYGDPSTDTTSDTSTSAISKFEHGISVILFTAGIALVGKSAQLIMDGSKTKEQIRHKAKKTVLTKEFRIAYEDYIKSPTESKLKERLKEELRVMRKQINSEVVESRARRREVIPASEVSSMEVEKSAFKEVEVAADKGKGELEKIREKQKLLIEKIDPLTPHEKAKLAGYNRGLHEQEFFSKIDEGRAFKEKPTKFLNNYASETAFLQERYTRVYSYKNNGGINKITHAVNKRLSNPTVEGVMMVVGIAAIAIAVLINGGTVGLDLAAPTKSALVESTLSQADAMGEEIQSLFTQYNQVFSTL